MNTTPTWILVLGSAAIGAVVSGLISELGRWRERKYRREELLLTKALELASIRLETMKEVAQQSSGPGTILIQDSALMTETYYGWLKELMQTGKLPKDAHERNAFSRIKKKTP
jgi:hypothetical protein